MPYVSTGLSIDLIDAVGVALFPFAVSFLFPVYVNLYDIKRKTRRSFSLKCLSFYRLVMEKEKKLREMMKMVHI